MSKVIFKSPFAKSGKAFGGKYLKYIAKRDGVDKSINARMVDINTQYIATRPGVMKLGEHGLFGQEDYIDLDKTAQEVKEHNGKVWRPIISLRREDADRLGYNNPYRWRTLLRSMQIELAATYRIPIDDFVWYAAYHDEGDHPHIHMIIYNKNPGGEYLTDVDCNNIRNDLIKTIFKDDLKQLYDQRQTVRERIIENVMDRVDADDIYTGNPTDDFYESYNELKLCLKGYTGKKNYRFLSSEQKKAVDKAVKSICKDNKIQYEYAQWCQIQMAILRHYYDEPKDCFGDIYENKDIEKRIRNILLKSVLKNIEQSNENIDEVYEDIVFSICKMIDSSIDQTIDECHSPSIIDSKERIKLAKQKRALGIKMEGW